MLLKNNFRIVFYVIRWSICANLFTKINQLLYPETLNSFESIFGGNMIGIQYKLWQKTKKLSVRIYLTWSSGYCLSFAIRWTTVVYAAKLWCYILASGTSFFNPYFINSTWFWNYGELLHKKKNRMNITIVASMPLIVSIILNINILFNISN